MGGYVQKRGKGSFQLVVTLGHNGNGKRIRRTRTIKTKSSKEANLALAKFMTEIEAGEYIKPEKMAFGAFVEEWKSKYAEKTLAPTTYYSYLRTLEKRILPVFHNMKLSEVKPFHIINYLDDLQKPGQHSKEEGGSLSPSVLLFNYRVLRNIFSRAVDWQLIKTNPVEKVPKPKIKPAQANAYDNEEIQTLFAALEDAPERWQVMLNLVIATGLRRGEALGLEWKHVDLEAGTLEVAQTVQYISGQGSLIRPPKTGKPRKMALPDYIINMLKDYKKKKQKEKLQAGELWAWPNNEHFFVFSSWDGKPLHATSVGKWWSRFVKRKGLKHIRFHDLRHTSATYLINQGVHPKMISERLGHADITTTMNVYGHVLQEADRQTAQKFDGMFAQSQHKKA